MEEHPLKPEHQRLLTDNITPGKPQFTDRKMNLVILPQQPSPADLLPKDWTTEKLWPSCSLKVLTWSWIISTGGSSYSPDFFSLLLPHLSALRKDAFPVQARDHLLAITCKPCSQKMQDQSTIPGTAFQFCQKEYSIFKPQCSRPS